MARVGRMQVVFFTIFNVLVGVAQSCKQRQDVSLVFELPGGTPTQLPKVRDVIQKLDESLNLIDHSCVRLGIVLVWKQVDVLTKLSCPYRESKCYTDALSKVMKLAENEMKANEYSSSYDKNRLGTAIDVGQKMLHSGNDGARMGIEKSMILVLSNPPAPNAIPTDDAVKDLHDLGVRLYVIAIGDGQKEPLEYIALDDADVFKSKDMDMVTKGVIDLIGNFITGKMVETRVGDAQVFGTSGVPGAFVLEGDAPVETLPVPIRRNVAEMERQQTIIADSIKKCEYKLDIGFLIDASGSMKKYYSDEKYFIKRIAAKFGISESGTHAGVVVFSSGSYVKLLVPLNKHNDLKSFSKTVDALPFYKYQTRIDKALTVADTEMFQLANGSRPNIGKILFLVTDGRQQPRDLDGTEKVLSPGIAARPFHQRGIPIFAIGVGNKVNKTELESITTTDDNIFTVKNFSYLVSDKFVEKISKKACFKPGELASSPAVVTFTTTTQTRTTTQPSKTASKITTEDQSTAATKIGSKGKTTTATKEATTGEAQPTTATTPKAKEECMCDCCKGCDKKQKCGCKSGCVEKHPVYVNVFNGANSNNVVIQNSKVIQNVGKVPAGSSESEDRKPNFKMRPMLNPKNMSSYEIGQLLKKLLPYQEKINQMVKELLLRGVQSSKNSRK